MQVNGKACIGIAIGIITILAVLSWVFHISVLPTLGVIGFLALMSIPIALYSRTCRAGSKRKVINVCIHDLELARKLLMTEGGIVKDDAATAAQYIESGEICVHLLANISWEGVIPNYVASFVLDCMRIDAERSGDTLDVITR